MYVGHAQGVSLCHEQLTGASHIISKSVRVAEVMTKTIEIWISVYMNSDGVSKVVLALCSKSFLLARRELRRQHHHHQASIP